jgi:hypothetical protein
VTGWLLDTNVLSELRRPKPNTKVVSFVASKPLDLLFIRPAAATRARAFRRRRIFSPPKSEASSPE